VKNKPVEQKPKVVISANVLSSTLLSGPSSNDDYLGHCKKF